MTYTLTVDGRELTATEEQAAIIDFAVAHPKRNLLINALAGAAKTSTLRFLCKYMLVVPTLSLAFNKRIADEMTKVLPGHVRAATMNSVGHRVWGSTIGKRLTLDTRKNYNIIKELIESIGNRREREEAYDSMGDLIKTLGRAKTIGYVPDTAPVHGTHLTSAEDFFGGLEEEPDRWFMGLIDKALATSIKQSYAGLIDFDDQIYMSTLFGGAFPSYARVMVDEAQDLNPLQHMMLDRLVGPLTQLIAVGDPWQSIYAFRGADTSSMERLRKRFVMEEMTLSVSFRCPKAGVKRAWFRVPHMKWPEWAIEGHDEELSSWNATDIPDGAAIICRNNAPLMSVALALLKAGRGIQLVGTDLGPQLVKTLKRLSPDAQLPQEAVLAAIDQWEAERLKKTRSAATVVDKSECLRVFANFGPTLGAAIAYCEHLFAARGPIQLLSGHKSKGLEWDVVYHLDPHRIPSPYAKEGEAIEQELNLQYVIGTRFKREYYLVTMEGLEVE